MELAVAYCPVFPAVVLLGVVGESATASLLVGTQVVLSLQLPFALVPLVRFTASRELMGAYANARIMTIAASIASMLIITCNVWLAIQMLGGDMAPAAAVGLAIIGAAALALLVHLAFAPLRAIGGRMEAPLRDLVARDGRRAQCQPL